MKPMKAFVMGVGWVTAAGLGRGREGKFSWGQGALPEITRKQVFPEPQPHFGRMDLYSKLGVAAIVLALRDAGMECGDGERPYSLIASSVHGCLRTDSDFYETVCQKGPRYASPHLFAYTVANTFLGEAAIQLGLTGPTFLLNEPNLSGRMALLTALGLLATSESEVAVTGVCDVGPPALIAPNDSPFGALFFVLAADPGHGRPYGGLTGDRDNILFEGEPFDEITGLAALLSGLAAPPS